MTFVKHLLTIFIILNFFQISYTLQLVNGKECTVQDWLRAKHVEHLSYNKWKTGKEDDLIANKREVGIHNMAISIGERTIDLIKDDVCLYPELFTRWAWFLDKNNPIVQRWACVRNGINYLLSFTEQDGKITLHFGTSSYFKIFQIGQQSFDIDSEITEPIVVRVNNKSVVVAKDRFVWIAEGGHRPSTY